MNLDLSLLQSEEAKQFAWWLRKEGQRVLLPSKLKDWMLELANVLDTIQRCTVRVTWRLVDTDNFGRDYPDEKWVVKDIADKVMADKMADAINHPTSQRYLNVVPHIEIEYKLQPGFEP